MRICLIGNNLTNFVLANVLADKKLSVDIIFNHETKRSYKTRTIGISRSNFFYLKNILNNKKINFWPINNVKIFGGHKNSKEIFQFQEDNLENFFLVKYNDIFLNFKNKTKKNKFINILSYKKKIDLNFLEKKNYNLVINSDSGSSLAKKYCSKKIEKNYDSVAYTFLINHQKERNNIALQYFTKYGIVAFLPLSEKVTSIVFSVFRKKDCNEKKIKAIINELKTNYKISNFSKTEKFDIKFKLKRNYYNKNILFFGDLIHTVHPLAGQGFNMTLRDIKNLSSLIDDKLDLGLELNSDVFALFENKTQHLNHIFSSGIDFVYEFFKMDTKFQNNFSKYILPILNKKNFLNSYAMHFADKGIKL